MGLYRARRGDNCGEEGVMHILGRVSRPIFVNLLLCPLGEHEINVRMTQFAVLRRGSRATMTALNPGSIDA